MTTKACSKAAVEQASVSLVIDTRQLDRICIDGPALRVKMRHKSSQWFPLRRLSRLHFIGINQVQLSLVLLCAEQNIPVAFFKHNGQLRSKMMPPRGERALIDHWFEHLQFDDEFRVIYRDWKQFQQQHLLASLAIDAQHGGVKIKVINDSLRRFCQRRLGKQHYQVAKDWLIGLLGFQVQQVIQRFGIYQPMACETLTNDLVNICEPWLLQQFATKLGCSRKFEVTPKYMSGFYQLITDRLENQLERMLFQLVNSLEAVI